MAILLIRITSNLDGEICVNFAYKDGMKKYLHIWHPIKNKIYKKDVKKKCGENKKKLKYFKKVKRRTTNNKSQVISVENVKSKSKSSE